jgi:lipid II:glycine glycyltransferase (peptidoglycan interpeptide bridge formation enzyme)
MIHGIFKKKIIENNAALLIYLRDPENKMIGASYFQYTKDEAIYHVAANDRALFNMPVGHLIQHIAVEEFVKRKIAWYNLGSFITDGMIDEKNITDKQVKISDFKKQFSSHIFPSYIFK